ncbi:MAG: L,D-transpeptidase [Myxococcales bacterium]|nr:L,D-transpeptidase [Myxococcales bacterium]
MGGLLQAALLLAACAEKEAPAAEVAAEVRTLASVDAGREPSPEPLEPTGPPKKLFAKRFVAKVRVAPKKEAFRIGYLRGGSILMGKTAEPVGFDKCRKGWFELETGGFICSTLDVIPFLGRRPPERRALQPDLEALLPYPYGYSRRANTPVYKRLPNDVEAALYEGYKIPGKRVLELVDGGVAVLDDLPEPEVAAVEPIQAPQEAGAPGSGEEEAEKPVPTLESLQGKQDSVLLRRMERGFYVSLDREMKKGRRKYWRTQANGFIPHRRLLPVKGSKFSGAMLVEPEPLQLPDAGTAEPVAGPPRLPLGYVMSSKHSAYRLNDRGKLRRERKKPGYHHRFNIVGEVEIRDRGYWIADDGRHYRKKDTRRIDHRDKPKEIQDGEKWLDINLDTQSLVAYEGERPIFATLVSTGRVKDPLDPLKNFETPTGGFRITSKHLTATMDGDHALDGPYSIEDVPYVMYFQLAYALHSAFWHNTFGRPRSHGCINLAPADARFVFNWATPSLPRGWHGIYPTEEVPGTRLYIRGKTPEG